LTAVFAVVGKAVSFPVLLVSFGACAIPITMPLPRHATSDPEARSTPAGRRP